MVIDRKSFVNGSNGSIPMVQDYDKDHAITHDFKGQVFFPLVSSLDAIPDEVVPGIKGVVESLTSSTAFPDSWGESSLKELAAQNMTFTAGADRPGFPLSGDVAGLAGCGDGRRQAARREHHARGRPGWRGQHLQRELSRQCGKPTRRRVMQARQPVDSLATT